MLAMSPLDPRSDPARHVATLWWWMLVVAGIVFVGAVLMLVAAWFLRGREGLPRFGDSQAITTGAVVLFGMAIPIVVLVTLFVVANLVVLKDTEAPRADTTSLTIEVTGHQWFWEVRYPGTTAVTANEIHIPARTRVNLVAKGADVIHSFWVPQLNRKIDTVPGHPNRLLLYADRPGTYRGQCAEFCGLQHAHMGTYVIAEPADRFRSWLANMERPRPQPAGAPERNGERVFLENQCASCHTIRGTSARGGVGPDLTHVATRRTLAALTIPNNGRFLTRWIADPQHVKPGNKMPAIELTAAERRDVVAYLESLH
jgi:cytochrome c oxidase subunit II